MFSSPLHMFLTQLERELPRKKASLKSGECGSDHAAVSVCECMCMRVYVCVNVYMCVCVSLCMSEYVCLSVYVCECM